MPKSRPVSFQVSIEVSLAAGCTARQAEIAPSDIRTHCLPVVATSAAEAKEMALDEFHGSVPIRVLDYVVIKATVRRA